MRQNLLLLMLLICATVAMTTEIFEFTAVRMCSSSTPVAMETVPGSNSVKCAQDCALRPVCFGFSWLQGLCRFFSWSAFSNAWQSSDPSDVYTRRIEFQKLKLIGCNQSFTYKHFDIPTSCSSAIDGNRNQVLYHGSCSHTKSNPFEWWEGQLAAPSLVSHVNIYNRQGCCPERLNRFSLQVDGVECNRVSLTVPFSVANFSCYAYGSRVRVVNLLNQPVVICEFEVYGPWSK